MDNYQVPPFQTSVAAWLGNARGAFVLFYDDGCDSAFEIAVPSLVRNQVAATFYLCAGWFDKNPENLVRWGEAFKNGNGNIFIGNHTWSHSGAKDLSSAEFEICQNDEVLRSLAGIPADKLMSYMGPGACEWLITPEQTESILKRRKLLYRPNDHKTRELLVAGRTHHTAKDVIAVMDTAESSGSLETMLFHGIGGDWFNFSPTEHELIIQELARRNRAQTLWTGACIEVQKYVAEREAATVSTTTKPDGSAEITLCVDLPPEFDTPLTLLTSVPDDWTRSIITIEGRSFEVPVENGIVKYDVKPASGSVRLSKK